MTPQEVDTVSEIFRCCFVGAGCLRCPLNKDDYEGDCAVEAGDKVFEALNRLRKLETPTEIEQPELPGIGDDLYDSNAFYNFMTDEKISISIRIRNALMRAGWRSIADFAESNLEEFVKVRNIGVTSWDYLIKKHAEARKLMGMEPVVPDLIKLAIMFKEKSDARYPNKVFS